MTEPDDATEVADALLAVMGSFRRLWRSELEPWELSPHQARALRIIGAHGPLRSADLADRLTIAPRSATEVVDALVQRDLARREPDPNDRRAVQIHLTADGTSTYAQIANARRAATQEFFSGLDETERTQLTALLHRIHADRKAAEAGTEVPGDSPPNT